MTNDKKNRHHSSGVSPSSSEPAKDYNNTVKLPVRAASPAAKEVVAASSSETQQKPHKAKKQQNQQISEPTDKKTNPPTAGNRENQRNRQPNSQREKQKNKPLRENAPEAIIIAKTNVDMPGLASLPGGQKKKHRKPGRDQRYLRVIALGGLGEIGKNMTLFEYGNDIILVDCGMAFPEENMPGIDAVIQDFSYVLQNKDRVRGIYLTHGHEDHIGALPYLMKDLKCPIYGGRLTIELVRGKLNEKAGGTRGISLKQVKPGDVVSGGNAFSVEFIHVNHSIADAFALAIRTPAGVVIHTGDFKIDYTPIDGGPIDLQRFAQYGKEGVLLLMAESTNIEASGTSMSESQVGESFQRLFGKAPGRVIVATFSSHVHRMQQIFTAAEVYGRKVALVGRSMLNVFAAANSLGYIKMQPDTLIDITEVDQYAPEKVVILTTGSQAEPMSALTRMAFSSHKVVEIQKGDTVIISAHPIPGNEKPIYRVINELFRRGAQVIYEDLADVHVSGHAYRGELMMIHNLVRPKYFVPVHGEYRMLYKHTQLAKSLGQSEESTFILNNGDIFELNADSARVSGYINAAPVLIDGSGIGDLDNRVLRDRRLLADDGVVCITLAVDKAGTKLLAAPAVQAVGFLYESESELVIRDVTDKMLSYVARCGTQSKSISVVSESGQLRDYLKSVLFEKTKRRPMILITVVRV